MALETKNETNPVVQAIDCGALPQESNLIGIFGFVINDCAQEIRNIIASASDTGVVEVCLVFFTTTVLL